MLPGIFFDRWGVWLFSFISFRVAMAALTAFALALWWGKPTIAWLRRHRVSERHLRQVDARDPRPRLPRQPQPRPAHAAPEVHQRRVGIEAQLGRHPPQLRQVHEADVLVSFGKVGTQRPFSSRVFQPTWSTCKCVHITKSMSFTDSPVAARFLS